MIEKEVEIQTADGTSDGFLYQPENDGRWPGVIQYPDIMGIRPQNRGMAKRLAEKGYVVVLPNPFYRTGKAPLFDFVPNFTEPRTINRFKELAGPLTPEVMERDGSSYVDLYLPPPPDLTCAGPDEDGDGRPNSCDLCPADPDPGHGRVRGDRDA